MRAGKTKLEVCHRCRDVRLESARAGRPVGKPSKVSLKKRLPDLDPEYRKAKYADPDGDVEYRVLPHPLSRYDVSTAGEVISWTVDGRRVLKLTERADGYLCVALRKAGDARPSVLSPARLIAEAFLGSAPEGMSVQYCDGNRSNLQVSNLYWGVPANRIKKPKPPRPQVYLSAQESVSFGQLMRAARLAAGRSQADVGNALGCSSNVVGRWERGGHRMKLTTESKIRDALGLPPR